MPMLKRKTDFTVIDKGTSFAVHCRVSDWDGAEWHWVNGWFVASYKTAGAAEKAAEARNAEFGSVHDIEGAR